MYIGDIYIPTVSELSSKYAEKKDIAVGGLGVDGVYHIDGNKQDIDPIIIKGILYKATSDPKSANDYAEDLMALEERSAAFNYVKYNDTIGFLSSIDITCPGSIKNIRKYSINAKLYPYSSYQHGLTFKNNRYDNGEYYNYSRIFVLPEFATNVHIASELDILPITPIGYVNDGDTTPEDIFSIYRPYSLCDESNYDNLTGTEGTDSESLTGTTLVLDAISEYAEWTVNVGTDIPRGTYKIKFRAKESSALTDIRLIVTGSISGAMLTTNFSSASTFEILESAAVSFNTHEIVTIQVTKIGSDTNTIVFDYLVFEPQFNTVILYDQTNENGRGNVEIYDSIYHIGDDDDDESEWKRVFSLRHKFIGDIIIKNELMSWRIDSTKTWTNTGILSLRDVETSKQLYPDQFASDCPDVRVVEITPYYITLDILNSSSLGIVKTRVIIDPLMLRFEVYKIEGMASGFRLSCTTSDLAFVGYSTTLSTETTFTIATTITETNVFALIPQNGYTTTTYKYLLQDGLNKPLVRHYISKRRL